MKIGIDLGGSHIAVGIVNNENEIIKKIEKNFTEEEKKNIIPALEEYLVDEINKIKEEYKVEMIGIAIPGAAKDGIILKTVNLGINNYDIASVLKNVIDVPVTVRNDGKCACLAEYNNLLSKGEITKETNMLLLTIGTGIGGGVIYNGKLLQGKQFDGFEMGHMVIKADGLPCKCGNKGCFEKYGSIVEHKRKLEHRFNIDYNISGDELRELMKQEPQKIADLEEEYVSDLSLGISNLVNIFEPDVIVLGGGFSHYRHIYVDRIKERLLNSSLLFNKRDDIDIRIAELGNDAGMIGASME